MEPGTKKALLIAIPILVIASVGGYIYWKHKKEEEAGAGAAADIPVQPIAPGVTSDTKIITNRPVGIPKKSTPPLVSMANNNIPVSAQATKIDAHTFLAQGGNISQKKIFGKFNGGSIFKASEGTPKFGVTRQGEILGVAYKAQVTGTGDYLIYFMNPNGVPLFVSDRFVTI